MSSQHKAPLAAFFVVSIACIVVVVNALRSDAITGVFVRPTQAVVAGARLVPAPQDILAVEAKIVARAATAVTVAHEVVDEPVGKRALSRHHRARHASAAAAGAVVSHVVTPAAAQTAVPAAPAAVEHHHTASAAHRPVVHLVAASNGKAKGHAKAHDAQAHGRGHGQAAQSHGHVGVVAHHALHASAPAKVHAKGHAFGQSSASQSRTPGHGNPGKGSSGRH